MLLTITTTHAPASDLGYLLHKHPARCQTFGLKFGKAHVFYPVVSPDTCTAALLLDIDPIGLVRRKPSERANFVLEQYVNDRPYAASSLMSVAIADVFGTALNGRCQDRPELAETAIPLEAGLSVLPCRGGERFLRNLFEPLGYTVDAKQHTLDDHFADWGGSRYFTVGLGNTLRLSELLTHLYVLIPVLDDDKHYWVGEEEVEKLLQRGEGWLSQHPERDQITTRYLKHQRALTNAALLRLSEDASDSGASDDANDVAEEKAEQPLGLHQIRLEAVVRELIVRGAKRVLDLGCGEGKLLRLLMRDKQFTDIVGVDVSHRRLEIASQALKLDRLSEPQRARIQLLHGSLIYRDQRLAGYDAAAVVEVIEHLDSGRLSAFERMLFEFARPGMVVLTTPNREYNVRWPAQAAGKLRHRDHRFEWTRAEFESWAQGVAERHGYQVCFAPIGPEEDEVGAPSQMGVFTR